MPKQIGFVPGDQGPSGYFRIVLPCLTLKKLGEPVGFALRYEDFEAADVLIFQRQHKRAAIAEILKWQARGKQVVIDFDDNFLQLDPGNKAGAVYVPEVVADLKRLVRSADLVTAATGPLAELYGEYCDRVMVIPNALPRHAFDIKKKPTDRTVVGWQGSDSHSNDLKTIKSVFGPLRGKFNFDLVLAGYDPGFIRGATFRPWIPFSPDLSYYRSFEDFTIGLCPLAKSAFNDGKSDLKWLEYSSLGIPTVAAAAKPYYAVQNEVTGLLARNLSEWEHQISRLLTDPELGERLGRAARDYVLRELTIEANIGQWRAMLASL